MDNSVSVRAHKLGIYTAVETAYTVTTIVTHAANNTKNTNPAISHQRLFFELFCNDQAPPYWEHPVIGKQQTVTL